MKNKLSNLPKGHYIFIWGGLIKDAGGMTRVMLDRLCRFKKNGIRVTVLLGGRGKDQYEAALIYRQSGFPEVEVSDFLCMEDWLADKLADKKRKIFYPSNESTLFITNLSENKQDVYSNGMVTARKYYDTDGSIVKIENYFPSSGEKRKINSTEFYHK